MASEAGLSDGERIVLKMHPHWKTVLRPLLLLAVIIAAALVLLIIVPSGHSAALTRLVIGVVALVAAIIFCAVPLLRWALTSYELTTRRLRLRSGVLTRTGRDFPLSRISDVSFEQGLLDRMLRCGRLIVESPGADSQLVLPAIPQVQHVQSVMFQLVQDDQVGQARDDQQRQ